MYFKFDMASLSAPRPPEPPAPPDSSELLRQMLDIQKEQLSQLRAMVASQDASARWRAFLARWREDFPDLGDTCRQAMPILERTYGKIIAELTESLHLNGGDNIDNEFGLQEFLDRYGMRLAQLGTLLNLVAPLAETSSPSESA